MSNIDQFAMETVDAISHASVGSCARGRGRAAGCSPGTSWDVPPNGLRPEKKPGRILRSPLKKGDRSKGSPSPRLVTCFASTTRLSQKFLGSLTTLGKDQSQADRPDSGQRSEQTYGRTTFAFPCSPTNTARILTGTVPRFMPLCQVFVASMKPCPGVSTFSP
jgi:hypothetical protein